MSANAWRKLIGQRVLVSDDLTGIGSYEKKVLEVSPSGKRIKFHNGTNDYWTEISEVRLVEVLAAALTN